MKPAEIAIEGYRFLYGCELRRHPALPRRPPLFEPPLSHFDIDRIAGRLVDEWMKERA